MERLVDPLTTIDAKLWADEFMKVKARLGEQEFDHAMMLGWFANAIMQGYDEGQRRAKADAQAAVEALRRELLEWKRALCGLTPGGSEFADDHAYCAEWVRKERENQHDIIISKHRKLKATQAALDAEREKVENLEHKIQSRGGLVLIDDARAKAGLYDQLETHLTQLQALVRGFIEAWDHDGEPNAVAYEGVVERARATLDATTPATMGSNILEEDIGKAMMRSKGGDDE